MLAEGAPETIALAGLADFAAVVDDLEVEAGPVGGIVEFLQVGLGLGHVLALGQFPALGETVDMSVDREGGLAKSLDFDDRGGLVADTGEGFEGCQVVGHLAAVFLEEDLGEAVDGLCLAGGEAARAHNLVDLLDGQGGHLLRGIGQGEEGRGGLVDPYVSALGGQEDRHQQGVGVLVVEGDGRVGETGVEFGFDVGSAFFSGHRKRSRTCWEKAKPKRDSNIR